MGKYTSSDDIRKLFREVDTVPEFTDTDIEFYIRFAESEVDAKLAARYTLPFSATPPVVRAIATEKALIKVLDRFFTGQTEDENDWRNVRKKECDALLQGIVDGEITLVNSAGTVLGPRADIHNILSSTDNYAPTFGHGSSIVEEVDPDRIQDEEDERL